MDFEDLVDCIEGIKPPKSHGQLKTINMLIGSEGVVA